MEIDSKVADIIGPSLAELGYDIVRVQLAGGDVRTLQIMVERADRAGMTLDDCARASRTASALLDIADIFPGRYTLEVSSPGLDRPLVKPADYERFKGRAAKIELAQALDGRRRFKGTILGIQDGVVSFDFEGSRLEIPAADIEKAKLILADDLLKA
ncbi:MAG: ribosome maturation factor RimP [Alphaproteobacteria bacterium]|nr:ribosome maturation factor RimP [Alphaproteobacteria bacterium]